MHIWSIGVILDERDGEVFLQCRSNFPVFMQSHFLGCSKMENTMPNTHQPTRHFSKPTSPSSMKTICAGFVPKNTAKATGWAKHVFDEWREQRNAATDEEKCPVELLDDPIKIDEINYWLSRFVVEVRCFDGNPYPATFIVNLLSGLYRSARTTSADCPNFMNRKESRFRELNGAVQVRFRELRKDGVGAIVRHTPIVLPEE